MNRYMFFFSGEFMTRPCYHQLPKRKNRLSSFIYAQKRVKIKNHRLIQEFAHILPSLFYICMFYLSLLIFIRFTPFPMFETKRHQGLIIRLFTHRVIHSFHRKYRSVDARPPGFDSGIYLLHLATVYNMPILGHFLHKKRNIS